MASTTFVQLVDDLDGGEADETVRFGLDGQSYEIDLNTANAAELRESLAAYVEAGRRVGASPVKPGKRRGSNGGGSEVDPKAVRAWARAVGVEVSDRGRVASDVVAQFRAAGN